MEGLLRLSAEAPSIIPQFLDSWERGAVPNQLPRGLERNVVMCSAQSRASAVLWQRWLGEDIWVSTSAETWIIHCQRPLQVKWTGSDLCSWSWIAFACAHMQSLRWPQVTHSISEEANSWSCSGQFLGSVPAHLMAVTWSHITKSCVYSMHVMLEWVYVL